jgi:flagellin-like protein
MDRDGMKRLYKNKKAVSPVIATVLMILVTMAGMTILFAFVFSYSESYKAGIGSSVMESLTVEDIWLLNTTSSYNNTVLISLYNVGRVDSVVSSIYVNGLALTVAHQSPNFNFDVAVKIGEHKAVLAYWNQDWISFQKYNFKISTKIGSTFNVDYEAP